MKKIQLMIGAAIIVSAFTACSNSNSANQEANNLASYVDSVDKIDVYTEAKWKEIDNGYEDINMKVEKDLSLMTAEDKEKVEASKTKYAALEKKYEAKIEEAKKPDYKVVLRKNLFGDKMPSGVDFGWMTAANVVETYENFVNTVDAHKDEYSKEDWNEIKVIYAALDAKKETLDKDISVKDRLKIAGLKTKYKVIKAVNKPLAD
ncbi:MAG: hypothetical protein QM737_03810 [Ferruginibacter sp.]